jgi:hypothetical protein
MPEVQQCTKCGQIAAEEIVIGSTFATKFSKFRATAGNTFKSPLDIETAHSQEPFLLLQETEFF